MTVRCSLLLRSASLMSLQRYYFKRPLNAKPYSLATPSCSDFIHKIAMCFRCRTGGLENIVFVVLQCFQPGSDIAFMLNLSSTPPTRYQEHDSQLGDQHLKAQLAYGMTRSHIRASRTSSRAELQIPDFQSANSDVIASTTTRTLAVCAKSWCNTSHAS